MQRLEVSGAVRPIYGSLGVSGLTLYDDELTCHLLRRNCLLKSVVERKMEERIGVTWRRGRRRKRLLDDLKKERRILEKGSVRLRCVENSLWKRLWTCHKTDYRVKEWMEWPIKCLRHDTQTFSAVPQNNVGSVALCKMKRIFGHVVFRYCTTQCMVQFLFDVPCHNK